MKEEKVDPSLAIQDLFAVALGFIKAVCKCPLFLIRENLNKVRVYINLILDWHEKIHLCIYVNSQDIFSSLQTKCKLVK